MASQDDASSNNNDNFSSSKPPLLGCLGLDTTNGFYYTVSSLGLSFKSFNTQHPESLPHVIIRIIPHQEPGSLIDDVSCIFNTSPIQEAFRLSTMQPITQDISVCGKNSPQFCNIVLLIFKPLLKLIYLIRWSTQRILGFQWKVFPFIYLGFHYKCLAIASSLSHNWFGSLKVEIT